MKKIICISLFFLNISAQNIITFFIKPAPVNYADIIESKIKTPHKLEKHMIKRELGKSHLYSGIYAIYNGNLTYSDLNGEIMFKRDYIISSINLLITENVTPVLIDPYKKALISGFIIPPGANFKFYTLTRKDASAKFYWSVSDNTENVNLAKIKKISYNTITLVANPDSVTIPTGNIPAIGGENLVLPDIFITPNFKRTISALKILKRRQYFKPVNLSYKFPSDKLYEAKIAN